MASHNRICELYKRKRAILYRKLRKLVSYLAWMKRISDIFSDNGGQNCPQRRRNGAENDFRPPSHLPVYQHDEKYQEEHIKNGRETLQNLTDESGKRRRTISQLFDEFGSQSLMTICVIIGLAY